MAISTMKGYKFSKAGFLFHLVYELKPAMTCENYRQMKTGLTKWLKEQKKVEIFKRQLYSDRI